MKRQLPAAFANRMQELLQDEYPAFLKAYEENARQGLRLNPLKTDRQAFLARSPFRLHPVPWCPDGFYYAEEDRPGKHPYHAAGLYYIQEPSAMAVAAAVEAQPGERILDLCAAPGGKSTQLAAALNGEGLLIANEPHPVRVKALSENVERLGIRNAIVTHETPERLADRFPQYFDRVLVDAPCSGEGMFRKLPEAIADWSEEKVQECHRLQADILAAAAVMLKPGGTLVYSTCTFAPLENEQTVARFLREHPEFTPEPVPFADFFSQGRADWAVPAAAALSLTARLWPHKLSGEGHYIAKLRKDNGAAEALGRTGDRPKKGKPSRLSSGVKEAIAAWQSFARETMPGVAEETEDPSAYLLFGEQLYHVPDQAPNLAGLKVTRPGWHLGTVKKNRFEPSHALALSLSADEVVRSADFEPDHPDLLRYLRGETISRQGENGWTLVCIEGVGLGWGKQVDGQLKNHYPKGLRWL
ncbi:NOL1/NOP2/sun family putative RNA methylase [Brevibacillus sp. SYP-B805]|uniref:RsmF rRNA methyltransferase first C-terminal domain-containing protein n=1 Tax=Brevibacillus sp. SYP-B805 TaxID=1578199 RepID=UPI0013EE0DF2|nr:RsmB/NOP family class I SAM-dependent RNA methyltransferase [Brevibacillus sp. SYP-B805]NGQ96866.1 NOL1/NOP2/sun family putative RNA methylase [Brevibacillus sp. SYP-B805]